MFNYEGQTWLNQRNKIKLTTKARHEMRLAEFQPLETYRPIEFNRNWGLKQSNNTTNTQPDEYISGVAANIDFNTTASLQYSLTSLIKSEKNYTGLEQQWQAKIAKKGFLLEGNIKLLQATIDSTETSVFIRPNFNLSKSIKQFNNYKVGFSFEQEQNKVQALSTDSLQERSLFFNQLTWYAASNTTAANQLNIQYIQRFDYNISNLYNNFKQTASSNTLKINGAFNKNTKNQWQWQINYRNLMVKRPLLSTETNNSSLLGNLNYNLVLWKGLLKANTQYQLGSGQKQSTTYYYEKVADGNGNYVWNDDGDTIEELDEFELATENNQIDAHYIRILLPTGEYQQTNITQLNQSLILSPKALWFDTKGLAKFMSRFSTQSSLLVKREVIVDSLKINQLVPFDLPFTETIKPENIVAENTNIRNQLFFNRNSPKFEASLFQQNVVNQVFLINGSDRRYKQNYGYKMRYNFGKMISHKLEASRGSNNSLSVAFPNRNYAINDYLIQPALSLIWKKHWRFSMAYTYKYAVDVLPKFNADGSPIDLYPASINKLNSDFKYGTGSKSNIQTKITYVRIKYEGETNSSAAYTLLEGLQAGNNYLWTIGYSTRLANNIQLSLNYDGRKNDGSPVKHTGRASMRALF